MPRHTQEPCKNYPPEIDCGTKCNPRKTWALSILPTWFFLNRFETTKLWDVLSSNGVPRSTSGCCAMFKLCWLSRVLVQKVPSVASWIGVGNHRGGLVENSGIYGDVIDLTIKPYNLNGVKWWRFSCGSSKPSWIWNLLERGGSNSEVSCQAPHSASITPLITKKLMCIFISFHIAIVSHIYLPRYTYNFTYIYIYLTSITICHLNIHKNTHGMCYVAV